MLRFPSHCRHSEETPLGNNSIRREFVYIRQTPIHGGLGQTLRQRLLYKSMVAGGLGWGKSCEVVAVVVLAALSLPCAAQQDDDGPEANPARPTIATPATLIPVGYLQFETGALYARTSPELSSQFSLNEVAKLTVHPRLELLTSWEPVAHSHTAGGVSNDKGDFLLGVQTVLSPGEGTRPTIAASYFERVYAGAAPDLDIGGPHRSFLLLASADVKGFHYDLNGFVNQVDGVGVRRAQFGQTISVSHPLGQKFSVGGELWHFSQPFLRANAIGNLWNVAYSARKNLVFDAGFIRGVTSTSTHWQVVAGFTYLLPHKLWR